MPEKIQRLRQGLNPRPPKPSVLDLKMSRMGPGYALSRTFKNSLVGLNGRPID